MTAKTPKTEPQPTPWFRKIVTGGSRMKVMKALFVLLLALMMVLSASAEDKGKEAGRHDVDSVVDKSRPLLYPVTY